MRQKPQFEPLLSTHDVAVMLSLTQPTVRDMIRRGEIRAARIGRQTRITVAALETYLHDRGIDLSTIRRGGAPAATAAPSSGAATPEQTDEHGIAQGAPVR
ncbi:MAG: hypothetical protein CVV31_01815 [Methanomicrobiales archaeon HGW-Methanomicrobiales-2]|jgi:excisionase family DNA binding protein|nr:MAG: hypothetical protein CVV34_04490 [Methanomicrobiales archaeon HGW-Methanomicrobiales-5]PKL63196.1 MAG: hypothetical protein CVV31_01815 [Methanomicrobiales archaeon HGW-Methanomicrobiales-2]